MRRQRLLVVLNAAELDAQPDPALARAVFLARETNAALVLFASIPHPLHTVMPGKSAPHAGGLPMPSCRRAKAGYRPLPRGSSRLSA